MKQLFFVACITKQDKLHQVMTELEKAGAFNLEVKAVLDDTPPKIKEPKSPINSKREEVMEVLKIKGPMTGAKLSKEVSFQMKNPTGFLKAMMKTHTLFQHPKTKEYSI